MYYKENRRLPLMGVEAEVLAFRRGSARGCIESLIENDFSFPSYWEEHRYHCSCSWCMAIGENISVPIKVKRQHDASLTDVGTEFITSPFPANETFMTQALRLIEIIGQYDNTVSALEDGLENRRGDGPAEAGMHIHCSIDPSERRRNLSADFVRVMRGYAPEILALTVPTGHFRSNRYRQLFGGRNGDPFGGGGGGHHSFINSITASRVEWRMWEPAYQNSDYIASALMLTSSLTYLMSDADVMRALEYVASAHPWIPWGETMELETPRQVQQNFSDVRAAALQVAMEGTFFDNSILSASIAYAQEAWGNV